MTADINRQIVLKSRPEGTPGLDNFELVQGPVPAPGDGEVVMRARYLSLDPYMRGRMSAAKSYAKPVEVGQSMVGATVSEITASRHPGFAVGDIVLAYGGWQDYARSNGHGLRKLDPAAAPTTAALGVLGMPGMTAYAGLLEIGQPKPGETVAVAAASGAVGAVVGQIAKIKGCRAVGLTSSDAKCRWIVDELGFDAAINYKTEAVGAALAHACPNGIDVYFDNVGGEMLDACLKRMNLNGRVPTCGLISEYNATGVPPGPVHYPAILMKRLKVHGFIVLDYMPRYPEAIAALSRWLQQGKLKFRLEQHEGLENAVVTLRKLFTGEHMGKLMLHVA
jgi:NADPH-dependent curcumin reductase CurA